MKLKTLILSVAIVSFVSAPLFAQSSDLTKPSTTTVSPPAQSSSAAPDPFGLQNMVNNIDTNVDYFTSAKLEIRLGAVAQGITGSSFNSIIAVDYNVNQNFGIGGDIRNGGQTSTGMQSAHIYGELRHAMGNVEFTGYAGGGWRWDTEQFEGVMGALVKYIPAPLGAQKWYAWTGPEASMTGDSAKDKKAPVVQILAGIGYAFK